MTPDLSVILDRGGGTAASITTPFRPDPLRHSCRLQRPRTKGYRTPQGIFYAGRPSLLANQFTSERWGHARGVRLHRRWFAGHLGALAMEQMGFSSAEFDASLRHRARVLGLLDQLRGYDFECWCPLTSPWCHVDTYVEWLNTGRIA